MLSEQERDAFRIVVLKKCPSSFFIGKVTETVANFQKTMALKTEDEVRSILAEEKEKGVASAKAIYEKAREKYVSLGGQV